jgi:TusA-related sulfurtransferase
MKPDKRLDVNGKVCPVPAAETRRMLKIMQPGQVLEVVGDFEPALENVINIAIKNGAEVLEKESHPNFFRVVLKHN